MSVDPKALGAVLTPAVVVERKPRRVFWLLGATSVVIVAGLALSSGAASSLFREEGPHLKLFEVDRGPVSIVLVETGSLESARKTSIKCQVEALLGTTGGAAGMGRTGSSSSATQSGASSYGSPSATTTTTSTTSTKAASGSTSATASKAGTASISTSTAINNANSSGESAAAGAGGTASAEGTTSDRPTIRSFSYNVPKYTPLKVATTTKPATKANAAASSGASGTTGSGGGGRGGRGGRGGSGSNAQEEKAGSTRIIWLKPEGSQVKAGEKICELDSAAFRDELQAQRIKWAQAKSVVEQAAAIYQVNDITFREYRDGIRPQDLDLIRTYIVQCETAADRARKTELWSREVLAKKYRSQAQYQADKLALDQAEMALHEARRMEERLLQFTAPRILKQLEAKLKSIEVDQLAQRNSFEIEDDRLRRLERILAACTIKAPADGILVYNNQSNGWSGQVEVAIQEGATVREGQTLFDLPDPRKMRVKVKVNESKMASVHPGQRAEVRVEAFPGLALTGVVSEITPIPAIQGRWSDIKIYFANVEIDESSAAGLRPGMTAEVSFQIDSSPDVTRVPLQAVRWVGDRAFVAIGARVTGETRWDWRPVTLGLMAPGYVEVVSGLTPGEWVVATPEILPAPDPARLPPPGVRTAQAPGGGSHDG